jgi:hypothetical protein
MRSVLCWNYGLTEIGINGATNCGNYRNKEKQIWKAEAIRKQWFEYGEIELM